MSHYSQEKNVKTLILTTLAAFLLAGCPKPMPKAPPVPRDAPRPKAKPTVPQLDASTCKHGKAVQTQDAALVLMQCWDIKKKAKHNVLVVAILRDPRRALKEASWWLKNIGMEMVVVIGHNVVPRTGGGVIPIIYYYVKPIKK